MQRITALFFAACFLVACGGADPTAETERVRAQEQALIAALAGRDPQAVGAFYAADAQRFLPNTPPQTTQEAIVQGRTFLFSDPNGASALTPEGLIIANSADYAITEGTLQTTFTNAATSTPLTASAHYVLVWRREEDGTWKIVREVLTPSPPNRQ